MTDLETLTPEECWRLLGKRVVGRVGFDMGHGPRIHPVNYRVDGRSVVLRTSEDAELDPLRRDARGRLTDRVRGRRIDYRVARGLERPHRGTDRAGRGAGGAAPAA